MDAMVQTVLQAISTVGFPIVAAGALFWKINKQDEQHKEEMNQLSEVVQQNTVAVYKLATLLEGGKEHD